MALCSCFTLGHGLRYQKEENRDLMLRGSLFLPRTGECARAAGRAATDSVQLMARICGCLDARRRVKQSEDELTPRKGSILPIKLSVTELFMIFRCASISLVLCLVTMVTCFNVQVKLSHVCVPQMLLNKQDQSNKCSCCLFMESLKHSQSGDLNKKLVGVSGVQTCGVFLKGDSREQQWQYCKCTIL